MATSDLSGDGWCTSQLKVVLLGGRNCGKSSLGNLILGKEEFVTKETTSCSRRLCVVAGRWLTVVDTPGWWCDFSSQDSSELVKREIVNSVAQCSPGPHVFLITVKVSSAFSEKRRRAVEEHVALLGEKVWGHCLVVFTSADRSKHKQAEEHVESGGKALRWLSDKCNQRCHSVILSNETEVTELLVKIQKLVTENGNRVFEMQESILQLNAEETRGVEERAQKRFMKIKKHRSVMKERLRPITNIRVVLLGAKGSGKTSALNTILGREINQRPGRTAQCLVGERVVFGRQVTVVDTPGWWMNYFSDDSPIFDQREILLSLSLCPPGPHVFLLVIRVDRAFTETYRRAVQEHLELIGVHIWSRTIVLFSFGDWLGGMTTEQYIESEGKPLQWLVERCNNRYHVVNNKMRGDGFQVRELIGKMEEMVAGSGGWHYELERNVLEQLEVRVRREKERAKERLMKKGTQRQMARSQMEKVNPLQEMRIVLVSGRKTGKSSCGNTILSSECFDTESQTTSCTEKQAKIRGKVVTVLDTPGCFSVTSDILMAPSPCAIVLVVNVSSSFKDAHREALERQLEAGGGPVWSRAMVLFSYGDWLGDTGIEQRIEGEGEPLQRLVEKCGNRYHVLDNKHRGKGAQVYKLIELIEEMLVEERLAILQKGDHMGRSVYSAQEQQVDTVMSCKEDLKLLMNSRHETSNDLTESATSTARQPLHCSEVVREDGQIVALPAGRTAQAGLSTRRWTTTGQPRLTINLPAWFPTDDSYSHLRLNGECLFSHKHPTVVLVLPQMQHRMLTEGNIINVHSLCNPALRESTLRRPTEPVDLQALINQWGDSSLEELETFIDSYFETVWEQAMAESDCSVEQDPVIEEAGEEVLSSIDKKLSKLDLLEEIKRDLAEVKKSLEHSWKAIQELKEKSKQDVDNTC
ncbi:GTPase IMAP family member 8 [Scomber scombrus]|uniref:GTPase IMAP family member 8 n=1 Tax=Scomber scombrus TaxID=13677 RepID=UPI002DD7FC84|nr:GTPase IMAP family member 8 [Scomber scombrus]